MAGSIENLATEIFLSVVANDLAMPPRALVESAMKTFTMEFLEPARPEAIKAGMPAAEVESYSTVVASLAQ